MNPCQTSEHLVALKRLVELSYLLWITANKQIKRHLLPTEIIAMPRSQTEHRFNNITVGEDVAVHAARPSAGRELRPCDPSSRALPPAPPALGFTAPREQPEKSIFHLLPFAASRKLMDVAIRLERLAALREPQW